MKIIIPTLQVKRLRFKNSNYYASLNSTEVQRQANLDTLNPDPLLLWLGSVGSKDEWDLGSAPREETIYREGTVRVSKDVESWNPGALRVGM